MGREEIRAPLKTPAWEAAKPGNIEILVYLLKNSDLFRKKGTLKLNYKGISCLFYYKKTSYTVEALVSDHLGTRGNSHVKITGLLVVSLRGVNCRFCSHFGCLGWKVTIFAHWKVTKFAKNVLTLTTWKSPLGVSQSLSHTHIGLPMGFNLNFHTHTHTGLGIEI